jgi:hypothetical protein
MEKLKMKTTLLLPRPADPAVRGRARACARKTACLLLSAAACLAISGCGSPGLSSGTITFDDTQPGRLPPGWLAGVTGGGGQARWAVMAEAGAPSLPNVLQQSGEAKFCWCVQTNLSLRDGWLAVKFKPVSGKEDQAGGLIWRWQDGDNYYVARANALENNVTIYHTIHGERTEKGRADIPVASGQWHDLRVDFHGPHFVVTFDGRTALRWDDETFKAAGPIGVWTKADSVTQFDDFRWGN